MKKVLTGIFLMLCIMGKAQTSIDGVKSPLTISGYLEMYYSYDFTNPYNHDRPFLYSYNRHNEVSLNLGFIKAAYQTENVRANIALATGTYMDANLAAESGVMKNIYEANAGIKISKDKNLWVDAGVFASHIGFESAIGKDCWTLTRSLLAENSPYYESGVKVSYTSPGEKWFVCGLLLNGWQRIQRVNGNNTPAFGYQVTYKANSNITLNSSLFVGNDKPDSIRQMRYFHDFYAQLQLSSKVGLIAGFDIGAEQKAKGSSDYNVWYSPVLICRVSPTAKSNIAARVEYYSDKNGVIVSTGTPNGFKTWGYSLNYDYAITDHVLWRIECRNFSSKDKIYERDGKSTSTDPSLTTSLAIYF